MGLVNFYWQYVQMEDAYRIKSLEKESSIQYTDSGGGIAIHQTSSNKVEN